MERGSGIVRLRELAGVALKADAVDAAVLVAALRLDEARAVGAVGAHDVRVVFLAGNDGLAHEMEEDCKHGCRSKRRGKDMRLGFSEVTTWNAERVGP